MKDKLNVFYSRIILGTLISSSFIGLALAARRNGFTRINRPRGTRVDHLELYTLAEVFQPGILLVNQDLDFQTQKRTLHENWFYVFWPIIQGIYQFYKYRNDTR